MRLLVGGGDGATRVVELAVDHPGATIADLAEALGFDRATALVVDGLPCDVRASIADIPFVDGCSVHPVGGSSSEARPSGGYYWIGVTNGPSTGQVHRTSAGSTVSFGRAADNDLTIDNSSVSTRHGALTIDAAGDVFVEDHGSRNGTWIGERAVEGRTPVAVGERIRIGSSSIQVQRIDPRSRTLRASAHHADATGHIWWNRPPRQPVALGPAEITLPEATPIRDLPRLALAAVVTPLLFAGAMVLMLGSWRYALFGLLSPVMAASNWLGARRQRNRASRQDRSATSTAVRDLRAALGEAERVERERRRGFAPDIIELRRRVELPASELWERRLDAADAFTVRLGVGEGDWEVPVVHPAEVAPGAATAVEAARRLTDVELLIDLSAGHVGLVGDERPRTALLRSFIAQLATHHGPADLEIVVVSTPERRHLWAWTRWLPHVRHLDPMANSLALESRIESYSGRVLLIVDDPTVLVDRSSPVRLQLAQATQLLAVVSVDTTEDLPASVTALIEVRGEDGEFVLRAVDDPTTDHRGVGDLLDVTHARDLARSMARFADPELTEAERDLPSEVSTAQLLGELPGAESIASNWGASAHDTGIPVTIGLGPGGPLELDLVADGPHVLVAGTTGSGKSEFLRSLVIGLALAHPPERVAFALLDYKGGSAFDACQDLPHVVGVITDLDDQLAERAIVSLEAELRRRERLLRSCGASDIGEYRRLAASGDELPRLVIVVDEFATLRAELPTFVDALVSVAQRGRSLGVHLVLATQRPSGVVDANIRANTNLRVALRVQAPADSIDVLDSPVAASIDRATPGRAFVRRGSDELELVQTAYASHVALATAGPLRVRRVDIGSAPHEPLVSHPAGLRERSLPSELVRLVANVELAFGDRPRPRRPWLPRLPDRVHSGELDEVIDGSEGVLVALGDRPSEQARVACRWRPRAGHLGVVGIRGSGVSSTLRHVVAALGSPGRPETWVFAVDHGGGGLAGIEHWPHVACRLDPTEVGRHRRLLAIIENELVDRRARPASSIDVLPQLIIAVDGVGGFFDAVGATLGTIAVETLERVVRDGPALGITLVAGATHHRDLPRGLRDHLAQVVALEQHDRGDYAALGVHVRHLPAFVPGRALWGTDGVVSQVIDWETTFEPADAVASMPPAVDELPAVIDLQALALAEFADGITVPFGFELATHDDAVLRLRSGEHATVAGPAGSGKTNTLCVIAEQLRLADADAVLLGLVPADTDPSFGLASSAALDAFGTLADTEHVVRMARDDGRRWVVLIDDAHRIADESGLLGDLVRNAPPQLHVVVGLRSTAARSAHGHWSRSVRMSGSGLLLQPDHHVDGELLATRLPRDGQPFAQPGRGYVVHGAEARPIQVARFVPSRHRQS